MALFPGFEMFAAYLGIFVLFGIIAYVYTSFALMTIANKTGTPNAWLAWIPFANLYLMTQIAQVPWWTLIVFIVGSLIPFVNFIVVIGLSIWWWWKIAEARGKPGWWSVLLVIPLVGFVIMGLIAWSD